jgi:hypothetical protein
MLQDDCHLVRVLAAQPLRELHAFGLGIERDVEVVVAHQTLLCGFRQNVANDAAQGLLGQKVVANVIGHVCQAVGRFDPI